MSTAAIPPTWVNELGKAKLEGQRSIRSTEQFRNTGQHEPLPVQLKEIIAIIINQEISESFARGLRRLSMAGQISSSQASNKTVERLAETREAESTLNLSNREILSKATSI